MVLDGQDGQRLRGRFLLVVLLLRTRRGREIVAFGGREAPRLIRVLGQRVDVDVFAGDREQHGFLLLMNEAIANGYFLYRR